MRNLAIVLLGTSLALAGCSKEADGKVTKTGKVAPGEKLILVVTRTQEGECLSQIQFAGGPLIDLPMNKPVEIPVTAPASGELTFACGMNMFHGMIVAS